MTELDTRLRELSAALTRDAPVAPPLDELAVPLEPVPVGRRRIPGGILVGAAVVIVVVLVAAVLASRTTGEPAGLFSGEVCVPDPGPFSNAAGLTFGPLTGRSSSESTMWPVVRDEIPDFVRVPCVHGDGVIGWVKRADLIPQLFGETVDQLAARPSSTAMCDANGRSTGTLRISARYPVFAKDGTTLIGHIYPRLAFVALGEHVDGYPDANGLTPCDGDNTALTTQPASSNAALARPNAVNHDVAYDRDFGPRIDGMVEYELLGVHDDGKPTMYQTKAEVALALAAEVARRTGSPYNPADLLIPLRDEAGRIVGYGANNVSGVITIAEASDPAFDLCALQIAAAEEQLRMFREHPEDVPPGVSIDSLGTAQQRAGC
jgi:hypothetical protein